MSAFRPVQTYKVAIAATASPAQKINEIASILAQGKHPVMRVSALASHAIVKLGDSSAVTADATRVDTVTNGTFGADTDWTKGAGWTIAAGVATATGAISTALSQAAALLRQGYSYLTTYTATRIAGGVTLSVGGTAGTERTSSATFAEVIAAGATTTLAFTGNAFTGTIDNFSCVPNLLPETSFLVIDGAAPVDVALGANVTHMSCISEDETDTGNLHFAIGYYE